MANYATSALKLTDTYVNTLPYNTCSTAAATAAKTVDAGTFSLETGAMVVVKFTVTNTAASPTLNVSSTGAKAIYYNGAAITAGYLKANKVYQFIYNGTQWDLVGDVDTNTTYTIPTVNNATLTIQKNGSNVATFTANSATNATANITVPTKVSELTNDSGFTTAHNLSKGTDTTATKTLSFGGTFTAVTDTAVSGHKITDTTTTFTMPSDRLFSTLIPSGTSIPASANLNTTTYLKVGRYYCSKNADAVTLTNCPLSVAFMMEVSNPLSTTIDNETTGTWVYRLRRMTAYSTGVQYVQYCYAGGTANSWSYGDWYVVPRSKFTLDSSDKNGGSATLGSATNPVYVSSDGTLTACTHALGADIPADFAVAYDSASNTMTFS